MTSYCSRDLPSALRFVRCQTKRKFINPKRGRQSPESDSPLVLTLLLFSAAESAYFLCQKFERKCREVYGKWRPIPLSAFELNG